ncbi:two-component sensor histidine kinase [Longispora fulva]|nr:two-component sensor histidine kinase [Longispora fulva]
MALVAVAAADVQLTAPPAGHPSYACSLLSAAALLLRRRRPRTTLLLVLPGLYDGVAVLAAVFALYAVATVEHRRWRLYAATAVVALGAILPWPLADLLTQRPDELARSVIYGVLTACAPAALGLAVRTRAELVVRLAELAERRAREREWTTQRVLAAERARLAREMHDIVSHQVSLIAVTAAAWRVGAADDAGRQAAEEIRRRAALTLEELRHMVGILRSCPPGPPTTSPGAEAGAEDGAEDGTSRPENVPRFEVVGAGRDAFELAGDREFPELEVADRRRHPGLADLPALVGEHEGAVFAGLPDTGAVPEALQRAVYRTVQEALTNIRKHAPGTATTVSVSRTAGELRTEVVNGTPPPRPGDGGPRLPGGGHGLLGMRERAALLGGRLAAGPVGGGYAVRLVLPLADRGRMTLPVPRAGDHPCASDST